MSSFLLQQQVFASVDWVRHLVFICRCSIFWSFRRIQKEKQQLESLQAKETAHSKQAALEETKSIMIHKLQVVPKEAVDRKTQTLPTKTLLNFQVLSCSPLGWKQMCHIQIFSNMGTWQLKLCIQTSIWGKYTRRENIQKGSLDDFKKGFEAAILSSSNWAPLFCSSNFLRILFYSRAAYVLFKKKKSALHFNRLCNSLFQSQQKNK